MATRTVILCGNFHDEDIAFIEGTDALRIVAAPFMQELADASDVDHVLEMARAADLLIFRLVGDDPAAFIARLEGLGRLRAFRDLGVPRVFWSQDSHHMHAREAAAAAHFDRVYVAHHRYLQHFDPRTAVHLPTAFTSASIPQLFDLTRREWPVERDIVFPYVAYGGTDRNPIAWAAWRRLQRRGVDTLFGQLYGPAGGVPWGSLLYGLKTSRVVLNISLAGELNIRNFEAIAANRVLLTDHVDGHDRVDLDYSRTHFFRRDLSDFDDALDAALADDSDAPVWRSVPGRHMLIDRYVEIINRELGTDFRVRFPADMPAPAHALPATLDLAEQPEVTLYDPAFLLLHALRTCLRQRRARALLRLLPATVRYPRVLALAFAGLRSRLGRHLTTNERVP